MPDGIVITTLSFEERDYILKRAQHGTDFIGSLIGIDNLNTLNTIRNVLAQEIGLAIQEFRIVSRETMEENAKCK